MLKRFGAVVLLGLAGCAPAMAQRPAGEAPRRVILVIGDGVGLAQWSVLRLSGAALPNVARLPEVGLVDTRCACARTTDSAAGATAYALGERTQYRFIGMRPDSTPGETVLEAAEKRGMATGLVTTTRITDATPAAFSAHWPTRYAYATIAAQQSAQGIEVLLGGGYKDYARRADGRDLVREQSDVTLVRTPDELRGVDLAQTTRLWGFFADSTLWGTDAERPSLRVMAEAALTILDRDPDGFFLLLESEDTDDTFHDNLAPADALRAMRELDDAVAVALEYQARHPETLIVVTGDHETGGLALTLDRETGALTGTYTTHDHTSSMLPLFAGGPGAEKFGRWLTNAQVGALLFEAIGAPR